MGSRCGMSFTILKFLWYFAQEKLLAEIDHNYLPDVGAGFVLAVTVPSYEF